jgi:uncharacterized cupredoxin-like copper-binding protein
MTTPVPPDRSSLSVFASLAAVAAFLVAMLAVVITVTKAPETSGASTSGAPIPVSLTEFAITPSALTAQAGTVTFDVTNDGTMVHDFQIVELGEGTPELQAGASATLEVELEAGTYQVICTIPGHEASGMVATLVVGGEGGGGETAAGGESMEGDAHYAETEAKHNENMAGFLQAFQDTVDVENRTAQGIATEGRGNQPLEFTTEEEDGKTYKVFELTADITEWEVEPGKVVEAWTYNGNVPGPWIRVEPNDYVRVKVKNEMEGIGTDVHFHGISTIFGSDGVSPLTQPRLITTEDTDGWIYEFRAPDTHEMGMFHAHMHGQEALPNGMYGVFQVGDTPLESVRGRTVSGITIPEDLQITDEQPMVLNDAGVIGMSLNGKSYPGTDPIVTLPGDAVLIHYHNEGLQIHPMHLHHIYQLVVAKDGRALDQPYWVDTLNVAPGERYTVLVMPSRNDLALDVDGNIVGPGIWAFHCHILSHAEGPDGLFGMVTAWVVLPDEANPVDDAAVERANARAAERGQVADET